MGLTKQQLGAYQWERSSTVQTKYTQSLCQFCFKLRQPAFYLYKIIIKTSKTTYEIGLHKFMEDLDDWCMKQMFHLSASQILLMRPDLVNKFLEYYRPRERTIYWFFKEYPICKECYERYKRTVPSK